MSPRTIIEIVIALALIAFGFQVNHWRHEAARVPALVKEKKDLQDSFNAYRREQSLETARLGGLIQGYENEKAANTERARAPVPVIRLCDNPKPAPASRVPPAVAAAPGSDATPAPGGELHESNARDIGPATFALTGDADDLLARFRLLQNWARTLPTCEPVAR